MKKSGCNLKSFRKGVTLLELVVACAISVIPVSTVGILLVAGQTSVSKIYRIANSQIENEGQDATVVFGKIGRKSNSDDCVIYSTHKSSKSRRRGRESSESGLIMSGDAIELGYNNIISTQAGQVGRSHRGRSGNAGFVYPKEYAYFYLDNNNNTLNVDYSASPRGSGGTIINTAVLANNVTKVVFDRTVVNNVQQGCARMEITLQDPYDGRIFTVMAATLLRN